MGSEVISPERMDRGGYDRVKVMIAGGTRLFAIELFWRESNNIYFGLDLDARGEPRPF